MNSFFKELEEELKPQIEKILNHRFIHRIRDGYLNKQQLQYFALQYSIYIQHFPRFLSACAANVLDDETRLALVDNLWDEHGNGKIEDSHRVLYKNFAMALGISSEMYDNAQPIVTTEICVENIFNMCQDRDFRVGLGALGPGTEYFTDDEYRIIVSGLEKYDFISKEALRFWHVHISLDEDHYSDMVKSIEPWTRDIDGQDKIREGARKAIALEYLFWEGLEDHLIE